MMMRAAGAGRTPSFPWTDEKVATLCEMWATGKSSATQIACALGFGTEGRNAVIGKIHRLGLGRQNRIEVHAALAKNAHATAEKKRAKSEQQRADSAKAIAERKQARAERLKAVFEAKCSPLALAERREKQAAAGQAAIAKVELRLIDNPQFVARVEQPSDIYAHMRTERGYQDAIAALSR